MANIGKLPSAAELIARGDQQGTYGDRLFYRREIDGSVSLVTSGSVIVAQAWADRVKVWLEELDPLVVPYVNAFAVLTGKRVEKYWRTKEYRIVGDGGTPVQLYSDDTVLAAAVLNDSPPPGTSAQLRALAITLMKAADQLDLADRIADLPRVKPVLEGTRELQ